LFLGSNVGRLCITVLASFIVIIFRLLSAAATGASTEDEDRNNRHDSRPEDGSRKPIVACETESGSQPRKQDNKDGPDPLPVCGQGQVGGYHAIFLRVPVRRLPLNETHTPLGAVRDQLIVRGKRLRIG
jgi:hypothetical protein